MVPLETLQTSGGRVSTEGNTSAINSADGFGDMIDFCKGNVVGKVSCGISRGIAGDEICFTANEGKDFCDITSISCSGELSLMISSSRDSIFGFLGPVLLVFQFRIPLY